MPTELIAVVRRCLQRQRADRFASAADLRDALRAIPTESRSWAPRGDQTDVLAAEPPPVATPPVATPPVATPPVATPPVATPPVSTPRVALDPEAPEAEAPAVSALAQLKPPPVVRRDAESTGLRPTEDAEPAEAEPRPLSGRRGVIIAAAAVFALAAGIVLGLRNGTGRNAAPTPSPTNSGTQAVIPVPIVSVSVGQPTSSPLFDRHLKTQLTTMRRKGNGLQLAWTDPSHGKFTFLILLADTGQPQALAAPRAGVTSVTLTGFPAGHHCVQVSTVTTNPAGTPVYGLGPKRCVG